MFALQPSHGGAAEADQEGDKAHWGQKEEAESGEELLHQHFGPGGERRRGQREGEQWNLTFC